MVSFIKIFYRSWRMTSQSHLRLMYVSCLLCKRFQIFVSLRLLTFEHFFCVSSSVMSLRQSLSGLWPGIQGILPGIPIFLACSFEKIRHLRGNLLHYLWLNYLRSLFFGLVKMMVFLTVLNLSSALIFCAEILVVRMKINILGFPNQS